jgi:hypothetical protein
VSTNGPRVSASVYGKKMLTGKSAGLCPRKHRLNSYLTEELWEHDCRLSACPRVVTANFQCPRHMMEVLRNQSSREFCYQPEIWSFLVRNVWLGRFIYMGWCLDVANSGSCRRKNAHNRGKGVKPGL